ncbi:hypothetical protein E3A20_23820, partial [Planctomyces bekefii]
AVQASREAAKINASYALTEN